MKQKLAWGIISTGAISKTFAAGLASSTSGRAAAVASRTREAADAFAREFRVPKAYHSYDALLNDSEIQAVYIATPHPQHATWAVHAARAGKHILCEKPLAVNQFEAMAMIDAAKENGVLLMEAFMYRCHPQTARIVELIKSGAVGEVRLIQASFGFHAGYNPESRLFKNDLAGGGILDVGCYAVSMSRLIAGAARGQSFANPVDVRASGHLGSTGVDEWTSAILKFPGDIIAQVSTSVSVNLENCVRIFGSDGRLTIPNPWVSNRTSPESTAILLQKNGSKDATSIRVDASVTSFSFEADAFSAALAAGRTEAIPPAMTPADSLGNMAALDSWRESIGLVYDMEKHEHRTSTIHRMPLKKHHRAPMTYRRIPGVEIDVSRLVMGVDNQRAASHAAVVFDDFFERGGNAFDTAWVYGGGACENALGWWIRNRNIRSQVVVLGKGAHTPYCNPAGLTSQLIESLGRLQTDYLDIYLMHRDNPAVPVGEFVDVLNEHLRAGRIRTFGGSNWTLERIEEANAYAHKNKMTGFTVLSNNLSLARMVNPPWAGCISMADAGSRKWLTSHHEIVSMPWSSQARGFFTSRADLPADAQPDKSLVSCWYSDDNFERRRRAQELARRLGREPVQIALSYVLNQPFETFPLIGPRTTAETMSSLAALDITLSPEDLKWLNLES